MDGKLDRERRPTAFLMIEASNEATDWHSGKANCQVIVTITDVNDNHPILHGPKLVELPWPSPEVGTTIATLNATDPDNGANGTVAKFEFDKESEHAGKEAFQVSEDGVVTVAKELEPEGEYVVPVLISDAGTPQRVARTHITVVVAATTTTVTTSTTTRSTTTLTTITLTSTSTTATATTTTVFKLASADEIAEVVASMQGNKTDDDNDNDDHVEQTKKGLSKTIAAILVVVGLAVLGLCIGLPICLYKRKRHDEANTAKAAWNKEYKEAAIKNPVFVHSSGHGEGLENPNYADIPANSDKRRAEGAVANPTYGSSGSSPLAGGESSDGGLAAENVYDSAEGAFAAAAGAFPAAGATGDVYVDVAVVGVDADGGGGGPMYVEIGAAADSDTDAYVGVAAADGDGEIAANSEDDFEL